MIERTEDASAAGPLGPVVGATTSEWVENRPVGRWLPPLEFRELWSYRDLGLTLALRDLKVRYKQTVFGVAWALLQPLIAALIFSVVFGRLAGLSSDGIPYPVFVYSGLIVWLYFSGSVSAAAQSLVDNRELVSKVYFPRMLGPAAAVLPGLLDLAISFVVLGVFLVIYDVVPSPAILLAPVWILGAALFAFAVGLWLSALNVKYRDVKHALGFLLQVWMFASPVVYSASLVEGAWEYVYALNPLVAHPRRLPLVGRRRTRPGRSRTRLARRGCRRPIHRLRVLPACPRARSPTSSDESDDRRPGRRASAISWASGSAATRRSGRRWPRGRRGADRSQGKNYGRYVTSPSRSMRARSSGSSGTTARGRRRCLRILARITHPTEGCRGPAGGSALCSTSGQASTRSSLGARTST